MQALFIGKDRTLDYGKFIVDNETESITPNSYFYLKKNGVIQKHFIRDAKSILFKLPNKQGFNAWFKNKLGFVEYSSLVKEWNILTDAVRSDPKWKSN